MMYNIVFDLTGENGTSNVVATVLMVAITVALVALLTVTFFSMVDKNVDQSIKESSVDLTATNDGIRVTVLDQGNADDFVVKVDGEKQGVIDGTGDTITVEAEGDYSVIARNGEVEQAILTKKISGVIQGQFIVYQDQDDGSLEAELVERYSGEDEYEIVVNSDSNDSDSTAGFNRIERDIPRLLSIGRQSERTLQGIPKQLPSAATPLVGVTANPDEKPAPVSVGERIQIDQMLGSWCPGDDILLVGDGDTTVIDGDEVEFGKNCSGLRTVPEFTGNEITGVKVVNLWNQNLSYSVMSYKGEVEPPVRGSATGGEHNLTVEVYEQGNSIDTSKPVEDAEVVVGNQVVSTDSTGSASFDQIPNNNNYYVTANANGFQGTQSLFEMKERDDDGIIEDVLFDEFGGVLSSNTGSPSKSSDGGEYVISEENGNKTIKIGLKNRSGSQFNFISQRTIEPGESQTTSVPDSESSNIVVSGNTASSISSGSSGGGGSDSYSSGSGSTISGVYSNSAQTTQTLSVNENVITRQSSGGSETSVSDDITQPQRTLSVQPIDDSLVPTGEEIRIQVSARTYEQSDVTDTINIIKSPVGQSGSAKTIISRDITLPGGSPGSEVSETVRLKITDQDTDGLVPSEAGSWQPGNEYVVYASLESNGVLNEGGTLEVFDGGLTDSSIDLSQSTVSINSDGGTVSNQDSNSTQAFVNDEVEITLDSVVAGGASGETIDLFRNGELVKRVEDYQGGQITYSETLDESEFVDYHVGIMESQDTALVRSIAVYGVDPTSQSGIGTFEPNVTIADDSNCSPLSQTSGNYDCEIPTGSTISFDVSGVFDGYSVNENSAGLDFTLEVGSNRTLTPSYGDTVSHSFAESGLNLIRLTAEYNINSTTVKATDTLVINAYEPLSENTAKFTNSHELNVNEISVGLDSNRTHITETVDVRFESTTGNTNASGTYEVEGVEVDPRVSESVDRTVTEIAAGISGTGSIYQGDGGFQDAVNATRNDTGAIPLRATLFDQSGDQIDSYEFSVDPDEDAINADLRDSCTRISSDKTLEAKTYTYSCLVIENGVTINAKGDTSDDGPDSYGGVKIVTSGSVVVDGKIYADGNGYPRDSGPGVGNTGGDVASGASYGGVGGQHGDSTPGEKYGSIGKAKRLGSGGASEDYSGGHGGGSVWISSNSKVTVNGEISADGTNAGSDASGGSGGSIRIDANRVDGSGSLTALGGDGYRGGGGGRIAINATIDTNTVSINANGGNYAESGTIGKKPIINSVTSNPSIGSVGYETLFGTNTEHASDSELSHYWDFDSDGSIDSTSSNPSHIFNSAGTYDVTVTVSRDGINRTKTVEYEVQQDGSCRIFDSDTTLQARTYRYQCVSIEDGVTIDALGNTSKDSSTSYGGVKLVTEGDVFVNGTIYADGNGYPRDSGPGVGNTGGDVASGASYGGLGGQHGDSTPGDEYGSASKANRLGSGGASEDYSGGHGGGSVWISSNSKVTVNGEISADGTDGSNDASGGSGGSIRIDANRVAGSGSLTALGGDGYRGGGGGRIAINATIDTNTISINANGGNYAESGTIRGVP